MRTIRNIAVILGGLAALSVICLVALIAFSVVTGRPLLTNTSLADPVLNSKPVVDNSDQQIYSKPMNKGCFTLAGKINYCQTSKTGEDVYTGMVEDGQTLVYLAYTASSSRGIYTNGVVATIQGPYDLNKDPLTLKDAKVVLVATGDATQKELDSTWIDICRGDRRPDQLWWSYQPWALSNVQVDTYTFPASTTSCFKQNQDTYPSFLPRPADVVAAQNPAAAQPSGSRLDTKTNGGPISFKAGTPVIGYKISLNNGKTYAQCYLADPSVAGVVTDGVVYPWDTEISSTPVCK